MTDREHWQEHVDQRFDHIEQRLDELADKKQDKLPKGSLIGMGITIFLQVLLLAFLWGSQTQQLQSATDDRYRGADASRDFALRDQRDANMETDILRNSVTIKELQQRLRALEREISSE